MPSKKTSNKSQKNNNNNLNNNAIEEISINDFIEVHPKTENQSLTFEAWNIKNANLVLSGAAGCGKTFISLYLALRTLKEEGFKRKLIIVRSVVPTRDMGFLPGTQEEKESAYLSLYINLISEMFGGNENAYTSLVKSKKIKFLTTSFLRGITINNAIIIVDEFQNCNFHELESILTRVGKNTQIIFSGDYEQSDFQYKKEKDSVLKFLQILDRMQFFKHIKFTWEDCVRSRLVRDYLLSKYTIEKEEITFATSNDWSPTKQ